MTCARACSSPHEFGADEEQREPLGGTFGASDGGARAFAERARVEFLSESSGVYRRGGLVGDALRRFDPQDQRLGRRPARRDIVPARRRARLPGWLAELLEQAGSGL